MSCYGQSVAESLILGLRNQMVKTFVSSNNIICAAKKVQKVLCPICARFFQFFVLVLSVLCTLCFVFVFHLNVKDEANFFKSLYRKLRFVE